MKYTVLPVTGEKLWGSDDKARGVRCCMRHPSKLGWRRWMTGGPHWVVVRLHTTLVSEVVCLSSTRCSLLADRRVMDPGNGCTAHALFQTQAAPCESYDCGLSWRGPRMDARFVEAGLFVDLEARHLCCDRESQTGGRVSCITVDRRAV